MLSMSEYDMYIALNSENIVMTYVAAHLVVGFSFVLKYFLLYYIATAEKRKK
jgi:hypothetical protein